MRKMGMALATVALVGIGSGEVWAQDSVEWAQSLDAGKVVEVRGISGDIRVGPASGSRVELVAEKRGRRGDFDAVTIVVEEHRDGVTICAVYHQPDAEDCSSRWDDDDDRPRRRRGRRSVDVSVDFEVRLPAGVDLDANMVSGDIIAEDLESDVTANAVSGEIRISTTRIAEAQTVSGDIEVEVGTSDLPSLSFQTVSGNIVLTLPDGVDADVSFSSLTGDLDSELPLTVTSKQGKWVGSKIRGELGAGGPRLSLQTVSGDVELRRGR